MEAMTTNQAETNPWPKGIYAITLFVENLEVAKQFYQQVFDLPVVYEDGNSCVFELGQTLINLLKTSAAQELVAPASVASPNAGARLVFTLDVAEVDVMAAKLRERGVELLNGPLNRPWGVRTASFADPSGQIWEIAQRLTAGEKSVGQMNEIRNYLGLNEQLSCSGMPTSEQLRLIAETGVQTVINLAPHENPGALPNEAELVQALGMRYVHLPVDWNSPTQNDLKLFMEAMAAHQGQKMHVHCQANYRATAFIALDRILRQSWEPAEALKVMRTIWSEDEYPIWKTFIADSLKRS